MIIPHLDAQTEAALETMVDKFGLATVLNGLSCICSATADHVETNWQDKGRKPSIDVGRVRKLKADGLGASEIADALKIGRSSVYRVLEAGR
jgi:hypothetical protein